MKVFWALVHLVPFCISCCISSIRFVFASPLTVLLYPFRKALEFHRLWTNLKKGAFFVISLICFSFFLFLVSPSFSIYLKLVFVMLNLVVFMGMQLFGMRVVLPGLYSLNRLNMAITFAAVCFGSCALLLGFLFEGTTHTRMFKIGVITHGLLFYLAFL